MPCRVPVLGQLAHPRGILAPATGFVLNIVNRPINRWATGAVHLTGTEEVLDVGFGGGVGIDFVRPRLTTGRITGIDISAEMVEAAQRRFGGRVSVLCADVAALPFADASFDRAYGVNTVFFWPDPEAGLAEIHRVLRPGGQVVIAGPVAAFPLARVSGLSPQSAVTGHREVRRLAERAGFRETRVRRAPGAALIVGRR